MNYQKYWSKQKIYLFKPTFASFSPSSRFRKKFTCPPTPVKLSIAPPPSKPSKKLKVIFHCLSEAGAYPLAWTIWYLQIINLTVLSGFPIGILLRACNICFRLCHCIARYNYTNRKAIKYLQNCAQRICFASALQSENQ